MIGYCTLSRPFLTTWSQKCTFIVQGYFTAWCWCIHICRNGYGNIFNEKNKEKVMRWMEQVVCAFQVHSDKIVPWSQHGSEILLRPAYF